LAADRPQAAAGHTVGDLAHAAGVTVRALHYYDEIGLLVPSGRTSAGYRTYSYADLLRLQRVLGYRALGLPLDAIGALLDDPEADPAEQLRAQHALLGARVADLQRQLAAIEKTMEACAMGIQLTPQEMFEVFGDGDPTEHAAEAADRWGDTDAYRESHRRTSRYTKADWQRMKADSAAVEARYLAAYRTGAPASGAEAMDVAEAHRQLITTWFYDCSHDMHRALAQMYVQDERFTAHYDDQAEGLAQFVHDAVTANADRSL
jgi:DNA-binding transcriptional MerR regulator